MQVSNEIRQAWLFAVMNLGETGAADAIEKRSIRANISIAFEAIETEELMKWLTLQEKVKFGRKLLELTCGRDLESDLTEDR